MKQSMKFRRWLTLGSATLGVLGTGLVARTFLPLRLATAIEMHRKEETLSEGSLPDVQLTFLRCATTKAPACLAVRGLFSLAPRSLVYSQVLVCHPHATFLYARGLC